MNAKGSFSPSSNKVSSFLFKNLITFSTSALLPSSPQFSSPGAGERGVLSQLFNPTNISLPPIAKEGSQKMAAPGGAAAPVPVVSAADAIAVVNNPAHFQTLLQSLMAVRRRGRHGAGPPLRGDAHPRPPSPPCSVVPPLDDVGWLRAARGDPPPTAVPIDECPIVATQCLSDEREPRGISEKGRGGG